MRIGLIAPPWVAVPPAGYGGTESVVDGLARGLTEAGHRVVLFASGDSTCPVERRSHFNEALGIAPPEAALLELRHVTAAYEELDDVDIVHDHTLIGPLLGARQQRPVVATNHQPFDRGLDEVLAALDDRVHLVAISSAHAASAKRARIAAVIRHGVDVGAFPLGLGGEYALFLGRMSSDKGVALAVRAARAAGVPLVIAARCAGPEELEYFSARIRPLLGADVEYVGEVDRTEKTALLCGARCLLNPIQWNEPFGMVMIESLACGTPVVASDAGAAPEIVEDGVTGALAGDLEGLGEAVASSAALSRARCRAAATERFSLERMVREHLALYERVC